MNIFKEIIEWILLILCVISVIMVTFTLFAVLWDMFSIGRVLWCKILLTSTLTFFITYVLLKATNSKFL